LSEDYDAPIFLGSRGENSKEKLLWLVTRGRVQELFGKLKKEKLNLELFDVWSKVYKYPYLADQVILFLERFVLKR
jgi:hypothetical protein